MDGPTALMVSSSAALALPVIESMGLTGPSVLAVTGPQQYEAVLDAVHNAVPPSPDPFIDLLPATGVKLTPRHYSYVKISEGCNHKCKFCIIPDMRGRLVSRPAHAVLREAEKLVEAGVKELLVISQDTSAYGVDRKHDLSPWKGGEVRAHVTDLAREMGKLGAWVRLHYVYPYPHVRDLIPLMAEGLVLPYLDIPFQHAHPDVLKRMARPAAAARRKAKLYWLCSERPVRPSARRDTTSPSAEKSFFRFVGGHAHAPGHGGGRVHGNAQGIQAIRHGGNKQMTKREC